MRLIYAMLLGFILDLIFGDPHGLIHPVQIIGWFIDKLKKGMQHMICLLYTSPSPRDTR